MSHIPLSAQDHARLYEAQIASVERGDEFLAGTRLPIAEHGWWLADGIVVRDESGEEAAILSGQGNTSPSALPDRPDSPVG